MTIYSTPFKNTVLIELDGRFYCRLAKSGKPDKMAQIVAGVTAKISSNPRA